MPRTTRPLSLALVILSFLGFGVVACADQDEALEPLPSVESLSTAIFAAGCFWCVEEAFDKVPGVSVTTSGYIGGHVANPDYRSVSSGRTGHTEALLVRYDAEQVSYDELLAVFWRNVDATDAGGQFCDRGSQYRSGIFFTDDEQRAAAEASKKALQDNPNAPSPIVTEITEAGEFYPAEEYHQDYYEKNPLRYKFYKTSCGRAARLEELWGEG